MVCNEFGNVTSTSTVWKRIKNKFTRFYVYTYIEHMTRLQEKMRPKFSPELKCDEKKSKLKDTWGKGDNHHSAKCSHSFSCIILYRILRLTNILSLFCFCCVYDTFCSNTLNFFLCQTQRNWMPMVQHKHNKF